MTRIATWIMGTFLRWFPHRAPTGLVPVGDPDASSPVLVTCNYTLTVARLLRGLRGLNLWLLVAPSDGINVWCASVGGAFTDHQIIGAIKTSMLAEKVDHRTLILPPLCAPGVDRDRIREQTGFHARFGPVRAADILEYMNAHMKKTERMKRARSGLRHRLDMLVSMNFIIWAPVALAFAIFRPGSLLHLSILFWGSALAAYLLYPWIPGRTGWRKALLLAVLLAAGYLVAGILGPASPLAYWPWMIGGAALVFAIGFDLAGIAEPAPSDALAFIESLGIKSLGFLLSEKESGTLSLESAKCTGCGTCNEICPIGVYDFDETACKTIPARVADCFACGACVKQCPEHALEFKS